MTKFLKERIERAINAGKIVVTEKKKEDKKKENIYVQYSKNVLENKHTYK